MSEGKKELKEKKKCKEREEAGRKNVSAVVHARTHTRVLSRGRRWRTESRAIAAYVDRCETESDGLNRADDDSFPARIAREARVFPPFRRFLSHSDSEHNIHVYEYIRGATRNIREIARNSCGEVRGSRAST